MTDPIDETQPHATGPRPPSPGEPAAPTPAEPPDTTPPDTTPPTPAAPATTSGMRADPERPTDSGWREPAWFPPREKHRGPSPVALVAGLGLVVIGLYFFLDRTLGVTMPRIQWSTVWPVILIVIGAIVLIRSVSHRS